MVDWERIQITMISDSGILFKIFNRARITTELRLMIEIRSTREDYVRGEINDVGWISYVNKIADGMPELAICRSINGFMQTEQLCVNVKQCVTRDEADKRNINNSFANRKGSTVEVDDETV